MNTIENMSVRRRFLVIYDPEYKGYVVDLPPLPGCTSQGKTIEAAPRNVRKAIAAYLRATGQKDLQEIPEVLTSQVEVLV